MIVTLLCDLHLSNRTVYINISWRTKLNCDCAYPSSCRCTKWVSLRAYNSYFSVISLLVKQFLSQCWNDDCSDFVTTGQVCRLWNLFIEKSNGSKRFWIYEGRSQRGVLTQKATKNKLSRLTSVRRFWFYSLQTDVNKVNGNIKHQMKFDATTK